MGLNATRSLCSGVAPLVGPSHTPTLWVVPVGVVLVDSPQPGGETTRPLSCHGSAGGPFWDGVKEPSGNAHLPPVSFFSEGGELLCRSGLCGNLSKQLMVFGKLDLFREP